MAYYVGETIKETWTIVNAANAPVTGLSWNLSASLDPTGLAIPYTIVELGLGSYRISFKATQAGPYYIQLVSSTLVDGQYERVVITEDVDGNSPYSPVVTAGVPGRNRATIRQAVAERIGDYEWIQATMNGDVSRLISTTAVVESENHYRGAELLFLTGTNAGNVRRISESSSIDLNNPYLQFVPVLPFPTANGDTAEIYNHKGRGFRIYQYNNAINHAIDSAYPANNLRVMVTLAAKFSSTLGTLLVTDQFDTVTNVQYLDDQSHWVDIPMAHFSRGPGWFQNAGARTLDIAGPSMSYADGKSIRIIGGARAPHLEADTDTTSTDFEWLRASAALYLLSSRRNQQDYGLVNMLSVETGNLRGKLAANALFPSEVTVQ